MKIRHVMVGNEYTNEKGETVNKDNCNEQPDFGIDIRAGKLNIRLECIQNYSWRMLRAGSFHVHCNGANKHCGTRSPWAVFASSLFAFAMTSVRSRMLRLRLDHYVWPWQDISYANTSRGQVRAYTFWRPLEPSGSGSITLKRMHHCI